VTNILRALQASDPPHAGEYASNAATYVARLENLDRELQAQLAPVRGVSIITYHDAFPYFARRYGLQVAGVVEAVADVEPSLKYLAGLYRSARASEARAIFSEPPSVPRLARQMGRDLGLPVGQLDTLEAGALEAGAYEDAMLRNGHTLLNYLNQNASRLTR
jgi:ABC-type Zn uptake system ZnuABC Zn-binding protein ZnuA